MPVRFWKIIGRTFAALGALAVLLALGFYVYLRQHTMAPVPTRELGERGHGPAILIATQGSPYKDAVVETLIQGLREKSPYVRVTDISQLPAVNERDWDAIVILHSWESRQAPPVVQDFVERAQDRSRLVALTTSGSGESRLDGVDAITSASQLGRTRGDGQALFARVERALGAARVSHASP